MAVGTLTRNLRDGQISIGDGAGKTLILTLDNGDLSWEVPEEDTIEIKDRGILDHLRPGDQLAGSLSYSAKWTFLIGESVTGSSDPTALYEIINNNESFYTSTSGTGEKFTLQHAFVVSDPAAGVSTDEQITFGKVYKTNCSVAEGDDANTISFDGVNFETKPKILQI